MSKAKIIVGETGNGGGRLISQEVIDRMAREVATKLSVPLYIGHPRTPAKGIVHEWKDELYPFGTVLRERGSNQRVMVIARRAYARYVDVLFLDGPVTTGTIPEMHIGNWIEEA